MWYKNENGNSLKPAALDTESSRVYVYVRKNFELVAATDDHPEHWQWQEQKIKHEDWAIYQQTIDNSTALDDVYAALTELAEIIAGEA